MTILVIGGCGFIGTHIVTTLEQSNHDIVVLDRHAHTGLNTTKTKYIQGEYGNLNDLEKVFDRHQITHVMHLAASTIPGNSNRDPRFDVMTNVYDTLGLLDLCLRYKVRKILFLSSGGAVYGVPHTSPVPENHPTQPISSYGITKLTVEKYLHLFQHLHGLDYIVIRPANPFGPGQLPNAEQGVISVFAWSILHGEELVVWGDGSVVRDYFHVRDLARLCVTAIVSQVSGIFNAGSGHGRTLLEVISTLEDRLGMRAHVRFTPGRALDVPRIVLDTRRAMTTFNWSAEIDFAAAIDETRDWLLGDYTEQLALLT